MGGWRRGEECGRVNGETPSDAVDSGAVMRRQPNQVVHNAFGLIWVGVACAAARKWAARSDTGWLMRGSETIGGEAL
eukprot:6147598-Pleurochrysis_carterae.AAC.1